MREITYESIVSAVRDLCIEANCALPCDLKEAIAKAEQAEPSPVGRSILGDLVENYTFAGEKRLPICQDTGMAVVFCQLGQDAHITGSLLRDAVNEGVSKGYTEGFLRKSVVRDPIRRVNTDDNTPAVLHVELVEGDQLTITVAPKGFGSENMTSLHMLKPSVTQETIEDTIVRAVSEAGSNPCPPVVVGVGLGGDAELCAILAKKALLRPVDQHNEDPFYAEPDEFTEDAAARELEEETHVRGLALTEIGLFSGPDRDPRGWTMSCAYAAVAERSKLSVCGDDDAAEAGWFRLEYRLSGNTMKLKLTREDEVLTAEIQVTLRHGVFGTEYHIGAFETDGIAFDHCKMIAQTILKLRTAGRLS